MCIMSVHSLCLVNGFAPSAKDIDEFIRIITQWENPILLVKAPAFVEGWESVGG